VLDTFNMQPQYTFSPAAPGDTGFTPLLRGVASLQGDSLTFQASFINCCFGPATYGVELYSASMRLTRDRLLGTSDVQSLGMTMPAGMSVLPAHEVMQLVR